jgi:hypothetical protein
MARAPSGWWKLQGRRFLVAAVITAIAVVVLGWTTGLRQVMHGALLALAVAALLPLLLVAGGLLVIMLIGFLLALPAALAGAGEVPADGALDGAAEPVVEGGGWVIGRYYRLLGRQRHPVFWGIPAGVLFGGLVLWAMIAALVVPGETRTVRALAEAKAAIERVYGASGRFPPPSGHGQLPPAAIGASESSAGGALQDGFGRPFAYEVSGHWKLASWKLTSLGFDGKPGADDLCVSGSTKLMGWIDKLGNVARLSFGDRLAAVRALRCPTS